MRKTKLLQTCVYSSEEAAAYNGDDNGDDNGEGQGYGKLAIITQSSAEQS